MKSKIFMHKKDENGLAAIIIVTVLIVLLSLITVGFSRLMGRSADNAFNNQLATTATYAAQSGVNSTLKYIKDQFAIDPAANVTSASCRTLIDGPLSAQSNISSDGSTGLNCILINPDPKDIQYQQVSANSSQVIKLTTDNPMDSLMVSWRSNDSNKRGFPASTSLGSLNTWGNNNPVLRVTLYPIPASKLLSSTSSETFFLYPTAGGGSFSHIKAYGGGALRDGSLYQVNCGNKNALPFSGSADYDCNVTFDNLSSAPGSPAYFYVRLTPIYNNADLTLKANDSSNTALKFIHVQAVIDVTAKAGTAVKRIQERVDTNLEGANISTSTETDAIPENALRTAMAICKRYSVSSAPLNTTQDSSYCANNETTVTNPPPPSFSAALVATPGLDQPSQSATTSLTGTIDNKGYPLTSCTFKWGPSSGNYTTGSIPSCTTSVSGNIVTATGTATGLTPSGPAPTSQTYYFVICTTNTYNPVPTCSPDQPATMLTPNAPIPRPTSAAATSTTTATLNGTVNPQGWNVTAGQCYFKVGSPGNYFLGPFGCTSAPGTASSPQGVSANATGLSPGTTYSYQLCASNNYNADTCVDNATSGAPSFTTPNPPPPVAEIIDFSFTSYSCGPNCGGSGIFNYYVRNTGSCNITINYNDGGSDSANFGPVLEQNFPYWAGNYYQGRSSTATLTCYAAGGNAARSTTTPMVPLPAISASVYPVYGPTGFVSACACDRCGSGHHYCVAVQWVCQDPAGRGIVGNLSLNGSLVNAQSGIGITSGAYSYGWTSRPSALFNLQCATFDGRTQSASFRAY